MASWTDFPQWADRYLFLLNPEVVFKARVDQTSFEYPLAQVTFDTVTVGAFGDMLPGQTVLFGSSEGADDLGRQRLRTAATSTNLFIGWSSRGIRDGEVNLADDAYITVLDDYRAWAKIPRITQDGTLFKDFDVPSAIGSPSPPVANGGAPVLQFVDSITELITVDFDGTNSFATAAGASIVSYTWFFEDGTPSSSLSSTPSGVTFPKGFRWVSLRVIDTNAKQHTTRIPVAAIGDIEAETSYSGAVFSASSATLPASNAFDGNSATFWVTASPGNSTGWLKVQYATPQIIPKYTVQKSCVFPAYLTDWTMEGSNNDSDWVVLDTQAGQTGSGDQTYIPSITGSYLYYRLDITGSNDPNQVGLCEWNLFTVERNYLTRFEVSSQQLTRSTQSITFDIFEDIDITDYPDGTLVLYGENDYYDGVQDNLAGPTGRENLRFFGWHSVDPARLQATDQSYFTTTQLSCVDIGGRMVQLPAFEQAVLRDAVPNSWLQLAGANTDRYVHYLLHWHSTILDLAPFIWSGTGDTYALPRFASPGQNLWEQVEFRAQSMGYVLSITQRGQIGLVVDPLLQDTGDRTSTVIVDITATEWGEIGYTHQRPPRIYWDWGDAIVANTQEADASNLAIDAVFCVAPGKAPGQGQAETTTGQQIVADQDELNAREGHRYAGRLNPPQTFFEIQLVPGGDIGIDPALMEWIRLTIPDDQASQRGLAFTNERFLPFAVDIVHNADTGSKEVLVQAERETSGTPASTVIPETGDVLPSIPDIDEWPWIWEEEEGPDLFRGQQNIAAFDGSGLLHITNDFGTPAASDGPTWATTDLTGLSPALSGTYLEMVGDPFSPLYIGSGATVNGWILTSTGIYSITDIFGVTSGPTLALQHTLAVPNADYGFIATGIGIQNWVVAIVNYIGSTGTIAIRTTDGGSAWAESTITANYPTTTTWGGRHSPPVFVSSTQSGLVYAGAYTSIASLPPGALYRSADFGATWALATDIAVTFEDLNGGTFNIPWHDNAGQLLSYHAALDDATRTAKLHRTEANGTTITDITPGSDWGCLFGFWQLSICPIDRQRVAWVGWQPDPINDEIIVYVSKDAGDTWTAVTTSVAIGADSPSSIAIAGNDTDVIYIWGTDLTISYSQDFGQTWDDRTTKLSGSAQIFNIIGG